MTVTRLAARERANIGAEARNMHRLQPVGQNELSRSNERKVERPDNANADVSATATESWAIAIACQRLNRESDTSAL